jgi:glycosyltransferase involved in cell wall biosynthesis
VGFKARVDMSSYTTQPLRSQEDDPFEPRADRATAGVRVVHVTTVPFELPLFLTGQASFIRRSGFDLHAIASPGPDLVAFGDRETVTVHGIPMTRRITPLQDLASLWRLWRTLRALRPQVVHSHSPKGGLLGMTAAWLAGTPVRIYHIRGLPLMTATGLRRLALQCSERASCALAHRVLAVSDSMRRIAVEGGLCPADKIKVLVAGSGNGVDATGRFRPRGDRVRAASRAEQGLPPDAVVIGFVGRICADKGILELAAAWRIVREREPCAHLLVVGTLEDSDAAATAVVEELRRDPHVRLAGETRDAPRLYAAMDVVALPSYREGFPNVVLEASAMALPVVTTRVPGCVDAIEEGVTGTLVEARDVQRLAEALGRYLSDADLRARHGEAGRARVLESFRPEKIWRAIVAEYDALLTAAGLPTRTIAREPAP